MAAVTTSRVTPTSYALTPRARTGWSAAARTNVPPARPSASTDCTRSRARSNTPSELGGESNSSAASVAITSRDCSGPRTCDIGASTAPSHRSRITTSRNGIRRDHAARSNPGAGGRSSGHPRHSQPRVCTPSGRSSSRARSVGSNSVTHPIPRPWARAVSHMFWMAVAHDHRSVSGKVARPSTPSPAVRRSQATTTPTGASRSPSSFRSSSRAARSGVSWAACARRARSARCAARSRVCCSRTTMNRHGWECPTLGA